MKNPFLPSAIAAAVLVLVNQAAAQAQTAEAPAVEPSKEVAKEIQQVVVTGVASARGVRKVDSAFSITTANEEQLKQAAPSSTADIMKIVPGVYAESTGGQSGANIEVRGFPSGSDSPFVSVQMMGNPIFPPPTLSFFEGSSAFRLDDTIERVEVLRGGPSTIWSNAQPGATMNFILKEGTDTPEGTVRFTTGTGSLRRVDMYYGGKISDGWYGSVGGFYRKTDGVRDAGFPADDGHQITATLTRQLDQGKLTLYARSTDDKNAFYTGVPLISSNGGRTITAFPGFDPLTGTLMSGEMRNFTIEAAPGKTLTKDLGDGRGLKATVFGANFDQKVGDWSISNKFNRFDGDLNTIAMFTGNNPLSMSDYINAAIASANSNAAVVAAAGGPATSGTATFVKGGAVSGSQQVVQAGLWAVEKQLKSFTDELRVSKEIFKDNTLTVGGYFADYSSHDVWYLGNSHLMTAVPQASLINVTLNNGVVVSKNGTDGNVFYAPVASYDGRNTAAFISDEWKVNDKIKVDFGMRHEQQKISGTISNLTSADTDNNPLTVYNNGTSMPNGSNTYLSRTDNANSFTIGGNYKLARDTSVFVRANRGHTFISFDDLRGAGNQKDANDSNLLPTPKITQYEIGFKTASQLYTAYINAFHTQFDGIAFTQILSNGQELRSISGSKGNGVEFEVAVRPIENLQLQLTGDYQKSEYRDNPATEGKTVQRQPKLQFRFTPTYRIPFGDGNAAKLYATYTSIGERWADQANQQYLPSYRTIDAGVLFSFGDKIELRLAGTNLNNELGLTEGNSRLTTGNVGPINARPLFGRTWEASLLYRF
ncbi:Outer membrane receptor proteins, mostly Fe transport [Duganella sp. CF402]|uniref:TonB-dependent receptor n=1 Tax=unclassified Duganella TaxID=2636909 RepID=UPI0008ACAAAD|nr:MULTISPECIES: TonB-dependent receptor [unclassified Duganella]RZT05800.1 outer membrane receptor protein involved in Fe transport [Duganella sp. BK701]SEM90826.1 Outer membrane receptor proteins, mostly Fe transport [Duganella sp. CF402]